ncbi:MAG: hypothetical protein NT007_09565 [Candidatus Kapabacteria bacterium]|nr:hypothetical protein [Candidatus Kapabacteria bacterium]
MCNSCNNKQNNYPYGQGALGYLGETAQAGSDFPINSALGLGVGVVVIAVLFLFNSKHQKHTKKTIIF